MTKRASSPRLIGALVACAAIFSLPTEAGAAVGGGGAGARAGNFSRAGVAANGGFSSGARGTAPGLDRGAVGTGQIAAGAAARPPSQTQRLEGAAQQPATRQDVRVDSREAIGAAQSSTAKNVRVEGDVDCRSNCWDNGEAAAKIVAGAAVAQAVAAASTQAVMPCNVAPVSVSDVPYYLCGNTWYTPGYGASGVVYVPVPAPAGQ